MKLEEKFKCSKEFYRLIEDYKKAIRNDDQDDVNLQEIMLEKLFRKVIGDE